MVLLSVAGEVRGTEDSGTVLAPKRREVPQEPQVAFLLAEALWSVGRGSVWCPRSRLSPVCQMPGQPGSC